MTYILYGDPGSGSCTVECALAEIGAAYELRSVDLETDAQRGADYAAVNPQRKIPTLITPDGEMLTESAAILLVLDERHPAAGLLPPTGSAARAQAMRWLLFLAAEIYPIVEINDYPERFAPDCETAPGVRDVARDIWRARWLIVENNIAGEPFFLQCGFSLSDIYVAVLSRWALQDDWRPANLPRVERLTSAVASRPKLASIWRSHFP